MTSDFYNFVVERHNLCSDNVWLTYDSYVDISCLYIEEGIRGYNISHNSRALFVNISSWELADYIINDIKNLRILFT